MLSSPISSFIYKDYFTQEDVEKYNVINKNELQLLKSANVLLKIDIIVFFEYDVIDTEHVICVKVNKKF